MWIRLTLIVFALLDGLIFVRFGAGIISSAGYTFATVTSSEVPLIWRFLLVCKFLFTLSLPVGCIGLFLAKSWACILSYIQLPFRFAFMLLTFGFLFVLTRLFPERGMTATYFFAPVAMLLELVRVIVTIITHIQLHKRAKAHKTKVAYETASRKPWISLSIVGLGVILVVCVIWAYVVFSGHIYTTPHKAFYAGDFALLSSTLAKNPEIINSKDKDGNSLLHLATKQGPFTSNEMVEFFLGKGADVNARNDYGSTPLHLVGRNKAAATLLLANSADVDARNNDGCTPFYHAVENGSWDIVSLMLDHNPNLEARDTFHGKTPLHEAAECGYVDVVKLLLEAGADINARDKSGGTVLHWAALDHHYIFDELTEADKLRLEAKLATVRLLLDEGIDPNVTDNDGRTPMMWAEEMNHGAYIESLRELFEGASVPRLPEI